MGSSPSNHDVNAECAERIKRHKLCCSWGRGIHLHQFACQRPASTVDPAVPCTWGHAGPPHGPRRRPRTPFWAFSLLKKPFGRIRAAAAGPDVHGRGWDRKVRPVPFYPYPRRAPPTSSAGAAAAAVGLGGLFKSACPTSSARRPAPLAAVCKPGTPLDRSIYGDHTSHSGLHLPWTRRRPPSAPFYSTLPVGQGATHGRHQWAGGQWPGEHTRSAATVRDPAGAGAGGGGVERADGRGTALARTVTSAGSE